MSDPTSNYGTCPKCYSTLKLRTMEEHLEKCHESLDNKKNKKKKGCGSPIMPWNLRYIIQEDVDIRKK